MGVYLDHHRARPPNTYGHARFASAIFVTFVKEQKQGGMSLGYPGVGSDSPEVESGPNGSAIIDGKKVYPDFGYSFGDPIMSGIPF